MLIEKEEVGVVVGGLATELIVTERLVLAATEIALIFTSIEVEL